MIKPLKIYIAGPYSADTSEGKIRNTESAIDAALAIFSKGHFPYIPHLTHFVDKHAERKNITIEWKNWIKWDMPWLEVCDALFYLGSSPGAELELRYARKSRKQIFYTLDEIPDISHEKVAG